MRAGRASCTRSTTSAGTAVAPGHGRPATERTGPSGRFKGSIRCPYHAWTYGLDGELRNAPFLTESDGLRSEQLSLYPVAVETWGGFVFVNLTP